MIVAADGLAFNELERDQHADLVERIGIERDADAFDKLFAIFAPKVKGYLMRLGTDAAIADDLTQDVMVTLWRKADRFDRRQASVSTWVYRIASNRRVDLFRSEQRQNLDIDDPQLQPSPARAADIELETGQQEERVRLAIQTLPAEQRDLVQKAFYEELSHSDIAALTGLPIGTVKSRLRLAFSKLRVQVGERDP